MQDFGCTQFGRPSFVCANCKIFPIMGKVFRRIQLRSQIGAYAGFPFRFVSYTFMVGRIYVCGLVATKSERNTVLFVKKTKVIKRMVFCTGQSVHSNYDFQNFSVHFSRTPFVCTYTLYVPFFTPKHNKSGQVQYASNRTI